MSTFMVTQVYVCEFISPYILCFINNMKVSKMVFERDLFTSLIGITYIWDVLICGGGGGITFCPNLWAGESNHSSLNFKTPGGRGRGQAGRWIQLSESWNCKWWLRCENEWKRGRGLNIVSNHCPFFLLIFFFNKSINFLKGTSQ